MSAATGGGGGAGGKEGRDPPVSDAEADGAEADESGYRRDDYWREEAEEGGVAPDEVPAPAQGYRFADAKDKAGAAGRDEGSKADRNESDDANESDEVGEGRDDARIVDD